MMLCITVSDNEGEEWPMRFQECTLEDLLREVVVNKN